MPETRAIRSTGKGLLWQITNRDSEEEFFLFGTMHLRNRDAFVMAQEVKPLILKTRNYYGEMDLDMLSDAQTDSLFLPENLTLADYLPPGKMTKLTHQIWKSFRIDLNFYQRILPFFITSRIAESVLPEDHPLPLDHYLWEFAKSKEIPRYGLESREYQLEILQRFPIEEQFRQLISIGRQPEKYRKNILRLSGFYAAGDIHGLYKWSRKGLGSFRKHVLIERNFRMAEKIASILEGSSTFIAVGAGHLSGQKGLISLLKKRGFKLKAHHPMSVG